MLWTVIYPLSGSTSTIYLNPLLTYPDAMGLHLTATLTHYFYAMSFECYILNTIP